MDPRASRVTPYELPTRGTRAPISLKYAESKGFPFGIRVTLRRDGDHT
jgi:hypothetical protein